LLWREDPGFDVRGEGGTLWVEDGGASWYWRTAFSARHTTGLFAEAGAGELRADLPFLGINLSAFHFSGGLDARPLGFQVTAAFLRHEYFRAEAGGMEFYNQGGNAFFFSAALPIGLAAGRAAGKAAFTLTPSWTLGSGGWDEGSFYWFFGKPDFSALHILGLSLDYQGIHALDIKWFSLDLNILNNLGEFLFDGKMTGLAPYYRLTVGQSPLVFEGLLGWFHGSLSFDGALNASNQHYAFFPYSFYTVDARGLVEAGFAALDVRYRRRIFQTRLALGVLRVFGGGLSGDVHFKYKGLFGGREGQAEMPLAAIQGLGTAFFVFEGGCRARLGRRGMVRADLGLQKTLLLPFGLEVLSGENGEENLTAAGTDALFRNILLSGWTLRLKVEW
jgi:hypothetical protein